MRKEKITIVLPAYNAAKTLEQTYAAIPKDWVDDVILVDDASSDATVELSRSLGIYTVVHEKNLGYGGNQKTCYAQALARGADVVVMVHPDHQYNPASIPELVRPIIEGTADAVFGSRMIIRSQAIAGGMPYWKFFGNIFLTKIENSVLRLSLTEYHSGFRAYSRKALEAVPHTYYSNNFVFDTEMIVGLKIAKLRIKEIAIQTKYFPAASMIGFLSSLRYALSISWVMLRYLDGAYNLRSQ
ncbi:MAG: glycosyltransferase family 2 protein [Patescibacteria group bacterium]